jgi:hypothetical protein
MKHVPLLSQGSTMNDGTFLDSVGNPTRPVAPDRGWRGTLDPGENSTLAACERERVQEQHEGKHHYELTRDSIAQTLVAPKPGGVVPPFPLREVPRQPAK